MLRMFEVTNTRIQWYESVPIKEATAFVRELIQWANTLRTENKKDPLLYSSHSMKVLFDPTL